MCEIISFIRNTQARNKLDMAQYAEIKFLAEYIPGIPHFISNNKVYKSHSKNC